MHIVIGGSQYIGSFIAEELSKSQQLADYSITLIDENYINSERINQYLNVSAVYGNISDFFTLQQVIKKETKFFIACTEEDETNLLACILANSLGVNKNIAVTSSPIYLSSKEVEKYQNSGVSIINTTGVIQDEILKLAKFTSATQVSDFIDGKVVMYGLLVTKESTFLNKYIRDIPVTSFYLIGSIWRDGKSFIPRGDCQIKENDHIFLTFAKSYLKKFEAEFEVKKYHFKKVVIFGNFPLDYILANQLLNEKFEVVVICDSQKDKDLLDKNCSFLKNNYESRVMDILDLEVQRKIKIGPNVLFIAVSSNEPKNITACLLAKQLRSQKTIALINNYNFIKIAQTVGVDVSLSTRTIVNRLIQKIIHYEEYSSDFTTIANTDMEVLSLVVGEKSSWVNKKLKEIKLPKNSLMGILIGEDGKTVLPRGKTEILAKDKIIFFTNPENLSLLKKLSNHKNYKI